MAAGAARAVVDGVAGEATAVDGVTMEAATAGAARRYCFPCWQGGGGGGQEGESGVIETELYRHFDVGACTYFTSQTADVPSGHFVFVRQGKYGALSLVIVGGRAAGGPPEDEFTILIRGC